MEKLPLPKSLLELPDKDRDGIITVLLHASTLPKTKDLPHQGTGDEHNMWTRNGDHMLADAEDELYYHLRESNLESMCYLMVGMGFEDLAKELDLTKSFEPEFLAFEDELMKAKDSGRRKMSDYIDSLKDVTKKRKEQFMKWVNDGKALTKEQLGMINRILASKLPNFAKIAEMYVVRAGFIGKIRGEAEKKNFETLGAFVDRYPSTITTAEKEGVVLTLREKEKAEREGKKVTILPLTERESEAVKHAIQHAGDKITEISEKHRAVVRQLIIQAKRERWTAQKLAQALFDKFGEQNRDWRRVAITELAFASSDAYLSGIEDGETVIGMGAVNACKHCQEYVIGKTFEVISHPPTDDTYKSDMKQVWVGKSNYGRRVAEYRPAIPMHPNCRCRWHRISKFYKLGDSGKLELKSTAELINEERAKRGLPPDTTLEGMTSEERIKMMTDKLLKQ